MEYEVDSVIMTQKGRKSTKKRRNQKVMRRRKVEYKEREIVE